MTTNDPLTNIDVRWDSDARHYVLAEFKARWEWDDFYRAFEAMHALAASVDYVVDLIIVHHVALPPGPPTPHFKAAMDGQPPNVGTVYVVPHEANGATSFLIMLASVFQRLYPRKSPIVLERSLAAAQRRAKHRVSASAADQ